MNMCNKQPTPASNPSVIPGHLYEAKGTRHGVFMACKADGSVRLHNVNNGSVWSNYSTFGVNAARIWTDVTDDYCLTKV